MKPNKSGRARGALHLIASALLIYTGVWTSTAEAASDDNQHRLLESVRRKTLEQTGRSSNYACVQTIDRTYLRSAYPARSACEAANIGMKQEVLHDRLRLNMAVSKEGEIFSWHGEKKFSSAGIDEIVRRGPISSGSFVGFLFNIFLSPGVQFRYRGRSKQHGVEAIRFDFKVPKAISRFRVGGAVTEKPAVVPFHGSFLANAATFQLIHLEIFADQIPPKLGICSSQSYVEYQPSQLAGTSALVPKSFKLEITDDTQLSTVSRSEYSQCREFRAESKLRFDSPAAVAANVERPAEGPQLPADLDISIALIGAIDEKTAYTGDPVEARVVSAVRDTNGTLLIPKDATLHGIIRQLQRFYQPESFCTLQLQFNEVSFRGQTFPLRAVHQTTAKEKKQLAVLFSGALSEAEQYQIDQGAIVFRSSHLRLDSRFQGQWRTISASDSSAPSQPK